MIISGGFNIYPSDLEARAAQASRRWPKRRWSACRREHWGETPVAFVVLKPGHAASAPRRSARGRTSGSARPSGWRRSRSVDELPRSAIGKVLKRELRDQYAQAGRSS